MRIDWMWGWGGLGGVGLVGLVLFLVFWGLVIAALVLLIRRLVRSDERSRHDGPPPWNRYAPPPGVAPPGTTPAPGPGPGAVPPASASPGAEPASLSAQPPLAPRAAMPSPGFGTATGPSALETLRQRYARGEIDEAEFERRRAFLEDARGGGRPTGG